MSRIESGRLVLRNEEFSFQKLLEGIQGCSIVSAKENLLG
jgi:hypothetical protein